MTFVITAMWDGSEFLLDEPPPLEPGTRVVISVEPLSEGIASADSAEPVSCFDIAMSMDIDGPSDWSARIDHYLYGPMLGDDDEP